MRFNSTFFLTLTLVVGAFGLIRFIDKAANSGTFPAAIWHVPKLQVNSTIITIPGVYSVNFTGSTNASIHQSDNVTVSTRITKKNGFFGQDLDIPCTRSTPGTCTYDNACDILDTHIDHDLSTYIKSLMVGVDTKCPFDPASIHVENLVVKIPPLSTLDAQLSKLLGPFINGHWELEFKMVDAQNRVLAWLLAEVDLRDDEDGSALGNIVGALGRK